MHSRQCHILDESRAGQLLPEVKPLHAGIDTAAKHFRRREFGARLVQVDVRRHLPVADAIVVADPCENPGLHDEFLVAENLLRSLFEQFAHLGAGPAHRRAAVLDGKAAGRIAFVGRYPGIGRRHPDAVEIDAKLFRRDGSDRGHHALAQFHLAGPDGEKACSVDRYPTVQLRICGKVGRQLCGHGCRPV